MNNVKRFDGEDDFMKGLPVVLERLKEDYDKNIIKEVAIVWERSRKDTDNEAKPFKGEYFVERFWVASSIDKLLGHLEEMKLRAFLDEGLIE